MKRLVLVSSFLAAILISTRGFAETPSNVASNSWEQSLSLQDALNLVIDRNLDLLRARQDVEAATGVAIQTRAILYPRLRATGLYQETDPQTLERFSPNQGGERQWNANLRLVQSIYEGGRMASAYRIGKLLKQQALLNYQAALLDVLLTTRIAYFDIQRANEQVKVEEASVALLNEEVQNSRARFEAGTINRFELLRAEVELANAKPRLSQARNAYRIAKHNLLNILGFPSPDTQQGTHIPLLLSDELQFHPYEMELSSAILQAVEKRIELESQRKEIKLQKEAVRNARAGYKPSVQVFAGYGSRNSMFGDDLSEDVTGWNAGVQVTWDIFDGFLTRGEVREASARYEQARLTLDDRLRDIELEVSTTHSNFVQAKEVIESQQKVIEQAEEALELATARYRTGAGTQLDVLSAQTALNQARSTYVQALRDYNVALARLERAMGTDSFEVNEER